MKYEKIAAYFKEKFQRITVVKHRAFQNMLNLLQSAYEETYWLQVSVILTTSHNFTRGLL